MQHSGFAEVRGRVFGTCSQEMLDHLNREFLGGARRCVRGVNLIRMIERREKNKRDVSSVTVCRRGIRWWTVTLDTSTINFAHSVSSSRSPLVDTRLPLYCPYTVSCVPLHCNCLACNHSRDKSTAYKGPCSRKIKNNQQSHRPSRVGFPVLKKSKKPPKMGRSQCAKKSPVFLGVLRKSLARRPRRETESRKAWDQMSQQGFAHDQMIVEPAKRQKRLKIWWVHCLAFPWFFLFLRIFSVNVRASDPIWLSDEKFLWHFRYFYPWRTLFSMKSCLCTSHFDLGCRNSAFTQLGCMSVAFLLISLLPMWVFGNLNLSWSPSG